MRMPIARDRGFVAVLLLAACWPAIGSAATADLAVTINHSPTPGVGLTQLIYTVHVSNAGPDTATSIKVQDTLPPDSVFDSAGGPGWDCTDPVNRVVTCTAASLASGASAGFLGIAVIPAARGGSLVDQATVSAIENDPASANNSATDSAVVNPAPSSSFFTVTPCRIVDTRRPQAPAGGPALVGGATRSFNIVDACGVPVEATAVAFNVTVVDPSDAGDLRVYTEGVAVPSASTINFAPGQVRANNAVVPLIMAQRGQPGQSSLVSVQCDMPSGPLGKVDLVLDVTGYFR